MVPLGFKEAINNAKNCLDKLRHTAQPQHISSRNTGILDTIKDIINVEKPKSLSQTGRSCIIMCIAYYNLGKKGGYYFYYIVSHIEFQKY